MDTEKLRDLHKLKEDGVLSEEEYQAEKKKTARRSSPNRLGAERNRQPRLLHVHSPVAFTWFGLSVDRLNRAHRTLVGEERRAIH